MDISTKRNDIGSIRLILLLIIITIGARPLSAQTPGEYPWPQVWFKIESGEIVQITEGKKWTYPGRVPSSKPGLNFNPLINFTQGGALDMAYSLEGLSGLTAITVYQPADTVEQGVWATEKGLSRNIRATTRRVLGPDSVIDVYQVRHAQPVINTVIQNWSDAEEVSPDAFMTLGDAYPAQKIQAFKGSVAEFLVFNRALSFLERLQVETYLALKYGISLTEGNYVSSHQQVLWHREENQAYPYRIAGIGRDDAYGLHQKQAISAYDTTTLLTISHPTLATSNARNTSRMSDKNFLVWSDNDLPLLDKPSQNNGPAGCCPDDTILRVIERQWLMDVTGQQASRLSTELRVKVGQFPKDSLGYWLVIDRSGQGDFSVDNLEYITADKIIDSMAVYKNVRWDTDGSGTDNFGFARAQYMLPLVRPVEDVSCARPDQGSALMTVMGGRAPYWYQLSQETGGDLSESWSDTDTTYREQLTAGRYRLTVKDADDYEMLRLFSVEVVDAIAVNAGADQQIRSGQQIRLEATASAPDSVPLTYRWEGNYGFRSTGAQATVTESGIYTVTVTNPDGCQFRDQVVVSGSEEQKFAVLPTLVQRGEYFYVNVSLPEAGAVDVSVFDPQGNRQHHLQQDHRTEYQFALQLHGAGMYVVALQTQQGVVTQKLVIY